MRNVPLNPTVQPTDAASEDASSLILQQKRFQFFEPAFENLQRAFDRLRCC